MEIAGTHAVFPRRSFVVSRHGKLLVFQLTMLYRVLVLLDLRDYMLCNWYTVSIESFVDSSFTIIVVDSIISKNPSEKLLILQ